MGVIDEERSPADSTSHTLLIALRFEGDDAQRLREDFARGRADAAALLPTLDLPILHHLVNAIDADLLELHGLHHTSTTLLRATNQHVSGDEHGRHDGAQTPTSLASEFGHRSPSRVRAFLRSPDDGGPPFAHRQGSHWILSADDAARVRRYFLEPPLG